MSRPPGGRRDAGRPDGGARLAARLLVPRPPFVHLMQGPASDRLPVAGFVCRRVDGRRCASKEALLAELARAFAFPAYFGETWDSLEDALTDLAWLPGPGYRLTVTHADQLLAGHAADYRTFLAILRAVGQAWATPRPPPAERPALPFHSVLEAPGVRAGGGAVPRSGPAPAHPRHPARRGPRPGRRDGP